VLKEQESRIKRKKPQSLEAEGKSEITHSYLSQDGSNWRGWVQA